MSQLQLFLSSLEPLSYFHLQDASPCSLSVELWFRVLVRVEPVNFVVVSRVRPRCEAGVLVVVSTAILVVVAFLVLALAARIEGAAKLLAKFPWNQKKHHLQLCWIVEQKKIFGKKSEFYGKSQTSDLLLMIIKYMWKF